MDDMLTKNCRLAGGAFLAVGAAIAIGARAACGFVPGLVPTCPALKFGSPDQAAAQVGALSVQQPSALASTGGSDTNVQAGTAELGLQTHTATISGVRTSVD